MEVKTIATCTCNACRHEEVIKFGEKVDRSFVRKILKNRGWYSEIKNRGFPKATTVDYCPACNTPKRRLELGN